MKYMVTHKKINYLLFKNHPKSNSTNNNSKDGQKKKQKTKLVSYNASMGCKIVLFNK